MSQMNYNGKGQVITSSVARLNDDDLKEGNINEQFKVKYMMSPKDSWEEKPY